MAGTVVHKTPSPPVDRRVDKKRFDVHRLSFAQWVSAGSGFALLIAMSLPWYAYEHSWNVVGSYFNASEQRFSTGWEAVSGSLGATLAVVGAIGFPLLVAFDRRVKLPVSAGLIVGILGIVALAAIGNEALDPFDYWDKAIGMYVSPIAAAAVIGAGWYLMREEGVTVAGEWRRLRERFGSEK